MVTSVGKNGVRFDDMKALTAKLVRDITERGRYYDGDAGLFLLVPPASTGRARATFKAHHSQPRRDIGLARPAWLSLTRSARDGAGEPQGGATRRRPAGGRSVRRPRRSAKHSRRVLAVHRASWRDGGKSEKQWLASIEAYAMKAIGDRTVDAITPSDVLAVVAPIWIPKHVTARRVKQRISTVMKWAIAEAPARRSDDGDRGGTPEDRERAQASPGAAVRGREATL